MRRKGWDFTVGLSYEGGEGVLRAETGKGRVDRAGAQSLFHFSNTPYL